MSENYRKISVKIIARDESNDKETSQQLAGGLPSKTKTHKEYTLDAYGDREHLIKELTQKIAANAFICAIDAVDGSVANSPELPGNYRNLKTLLSEQKLPIE